MRKPALLLAALLCLLVALALIPRAFGQAATQTDHWCPEFGEIASARIVSRDWQLRRDLTAEEIALLQALDTSDYVTAHYGDPATTADNYWDGAPRDFSTYAQIYTRTTTGERRIIGLNSSASEPDVGFVVALLSTRASGSGEQYGMHDICAVFVTEQSALDAIWDARVAEGK